MSLPPVTTNLVLCYQADSYTGLADNDTVPGAWADQSGGGHNAAKQNSPKWRATRTPMGGPSIQLLGGSGGGYFTIADNTLLDSSTTAELFAVVRSGAADSPGAVRLGGWDSFYPHPSGPGSDSIYCTLFIPTSTGRTNYANPGVSTWHIFNVSHDGTAKVNRHNGTVVNTHTTGFGTPGGSGDHQFIIGFFTGATHKFTGEFAEILVYSAVLSPTDRTAVHNYLSFKHITDTMEVLPPAGVFQLYAPAPSTNLPPGINVPPTYAIVDGGTAELLATTLTPVAPADEALLPTLRPKLTVTVETVRDVTVEFEIADNEDFTDPVQFTAPAPAGQPVLTVTAGVDADLDDETTYFWRARTTLAYTATDWVYGGTFTLSVADSDALASGTWTVSTGTTAVPHLWFVRPPRGRSGDTVTAYGTGFGPTTVTPVLNGLTATVTDWDTVAPDADAYTADRVIDPDTGEVNPGHQYVTFTVPDGAYPGGALYVEGG